MPHSPMNRQEYLDLCKRYGSDFSRGVYDALRGVLDPPARGNAKMYYLVGYNQVMMGRITEQVVKGE